jgi:hypothetical protein
MNFTPNPNSGSLNKNLLKTEDKQPDLRGDIHVSRDLIELLLKEKGDLVQMSLSAWTKVSKAGNKYLSISVSAPYKKDSSAPRAAPVDDEDIPF